MNIVITGASNGIGYQTVKYLCTKVDGNIYAISRNMKKLSELKVECERIHSGVKVNPIVYDLENIHLSADVLFNKIDCHHIDIIINNAGKLINKAFTDFSYEEIISVFTINVIAPSLLIKGLISRMGNESNGHVVNISSMGGFQGSVKYPGLSFYSASKGALAVLTETLAAEYASKNIRFNCLALGATQTEMLESAFPGYKAPVSAEEIGKFITDFAINAGNLFNGKIIPVATSNP